MIIVMGPMGPQCSILGMWEVITVMGPMVPQCSMLGV